MTAEGRAVSKEKSRRGFASMDPETHRAVSARGGRTAHAKGTGRKFTRAGRGGQPVQSATCRTTSSALVSG